MLTDADFALRRTGITSTDITRLVGESPWGTKCDVYLEKISEAPPTPPTLYQRIGHLLEPLVLELLSEQFHVALARSATVQHPTLAWALATPDGVGNDCAAEAKVKSVSFARPREWDDDDAPPAFVHVQAQWHMIVKRVPVCYVGALLGAKPKFYVVEHDEDLASMLLEEGERFYREHILARVPPPVDGSEGAKRMLAAVWPRNRGNMVKASRQAEDLAFEYFHQARTAKEAEAAKELAGQQLREMIAAADGIAGDGWRALCKWREPVEVKAHTKQGYRALDIRKVSAP
jgi:putative phage-type endonuclease